VSDRQLERAAVCLLRENGFSADILVETSSPTPDIRANDPYGASYLLEIKHRTVAWAERSGSSFSPILGVEVMKREDSGGSSNALSRIFRAAAKQLEAAAAGDDEVLRLVWIFADPTDTAFHYECVMRTVYGMRVVVAAGDVESMVREGIYVSPADFVRWRNVIDGVLLGRFDGLFLNDLSPRYDHLKTSGIAQLCRDALFDPLELSASGHFYYLPPSDSSPTSEHVKARLEAIYGIHVIRLIDIPRYSAATFVPTVTTEAGTPTRRISINGDSWKDAIRQWLEETNPDCAVATGTPIDFTVTCQTGVTLVIAKAVEISFVDYARVIDAQESLYLARKEGGAQEALLVLVARCGYVLEFLKAAVDANPPHIPSVGIIVGLYEPTETFKALYTWPGPEKKIS
jgi:hypothetical protein